MELKDLLRRVNPHGEMVLDLANETNAQSITWGVKPVYAQRAERRPRAHVFHGVDAFTQYLMREKEVLPDGATMLVLFDQDDGTIWAVLEERTKTECEVVRCRLTYHPLWAPWREMLAADAAGTKITLRAFVDFLLTRKRQITGVDPEHSGGTLDAAQVLARFKQVRVSQKIDTHAGVGNGALNGVLAETTIANKTTQHELVLPDTLIVTAPLYVGTDARGIEVDVLVGMDGGGPTVRVASSDYETQRCDAVDSMVEYMRTALDAAGPNTVQVEVGRGEVRFEEWHYRKPEKVIVDTLD